MTEEDQKYLAEKMGLGTHPVLYDFTYWDGFGKVFEWAKKQQWFADFMYSIHDDQLYYGENDHEHYLVLPVYIIGPRFAEAVMKFLRGMEK